ncbi:MAG: hypothetical protein B7X37_02145 [Halothiobacillus sp. 14-55-98]|nr:MAG: hypothetical protein B7X37_02145 [Halothiobacillus sp. 14-55-98]
MSSSLRALLDAVPPLPVDMSLDAVTERFQEGGFDRMLSLAVVDEDRQPVGLISRHALMELLLNKYSRDLYGRRPIQYFMNTQPVIVSLAESTSSVISTVTAQIRTPIIEDFIFTEADGSYAGLGSVADVLKLVEQRLDQRNHALAQANQEIKASQAHLVQSEKMAALGTCRWPKKCWGKFTDWSLPTTVCSKTCSTPLPSNPMWKRKFRRLPPCARSLMPSMIWPI